MARTAGAPMDFAPRAIDRPELDPGLPIRAMGAMDDASSGARSRCRDSCPLLGLFGGMALLLMAAGAYAGSSFSRCRSGCRRWASAWRSAPDAVRSFD
jgi:hypothetical protein